MPKKGTKRKVSRIPGQSKPKDSSAAIFWRNNERFAEVFSKIAMNGCPIDPNELTEQDSAESSLIRIMENVNIPIKLMRDVIKGLKSGVMLVILGLENQDYIDYLMPYRVLSCDFINISKQISEIQTRNTQDKKGLDKNEVMSRFKKTDKISPVITLVIYYGKEPWDGPTKLSDLYIDSPYKSYAADYPMYLLDVCGMSDNQINEFSTELKAFFGFLKYEKENTEKLVDFVNENSDYFHNLPSETMQALIELTKSAELEKIQTENMTPEGGVNMCNGIQYYANQVAMEKARQSYIESAQDFGHSIADTINKFIVKFNVTEEEAKADIKKYWKET